jgi:hypothetical protein
MLPYGHAGQLTRIRDSRVVDEHVEAAKLLADALRRRGDRSLIRHVELEGACVRPNLLGRTLAALEIARPDQHSKAVYHEIFCDLKTDSLISPGDQGDGFVLHSNLLNLYLFVGFESVPTHRMIASAICFRNQRVL